MPVLRKQVSASAGVHTIGSPRTLKDVLTITGQPVRQGDALLFATGQLRREVRKAVAQADALQ